MAETCRWIVTPRKQGTVPRETQQSAVRDGVGVPWFWSLVIKINKLWKCLNIRLDHLSASHPLKQVCRVGYTQRTLRDAADADPGDRPFSPRSVIEIKAARHHARRGSGPVAAENGRSAKVRKLYLTPAS